MTGSPSRRSTTGCPRTCPRGFRSISSRPTRCSAAARTQRPPRRGVQRWRFSPTAFRRPPLLRPPMRLPSAATTRATSGASAGSMILTIKPRGERKPSSTTRTSTSRPERRAQSATARRTTCLPISRNAAALSVFYDGGHHVNWGGRFREEVHLAPNWIGYVAAGVESTTIAAVNTIFSFPGGAAVPGYFPIQRDFLNYAPEGGMLYRLNDAWQFRSRVATGYGTPQISNLTVTAQGVSGNNSQLASQTNVGIDVGTDWTPHAALKLSVTGFYEFFRNELVTQSPGAGLQNFTFNVPRSVHRGVEVAADWRPLPGWRLIAAYTWLDQFYIDYTEQLSAGVLTARFDRAGNKIPGVAPNELFTRLGYDQPFGPWKGVGGFVEYVWLDAFYMENANLLKAPSYGLFNLNVHYDTDIPDDYLKGAIFFFEIKNVLNKTYVASANNITDSINATTGIQNPGSILAATGTGSIYAGAPRTFVAGMKLAFR